MNIQGNSERVFNQLLAWRLGIYQVLDPETVTFLGRHNVHYRFLVFCTIYQCVMAVLMGLCGLYYFMNNIVVSIPYFSFLVNMVYASYKMYILLNYSNIIWDCMSVTRFEFTSCGLRGRYTLDMWRNISIKKTNIYTIFFLSMLISYVACPLVFNNTFITMKNHDGSFSVYRLNVLNLYLYFSEETYNTYFYFIYIAETMGISVCVVFVIIFDTVVNTLGYALSGQLQMMSTALESFGHKSLESPNSKFLQHWRACIT